MDSGPAFAIDIRPKKGVMLVLTRRISVLRIDGNRVKIGVDAPPDVSILRQEIVDNAVDRQTPELLASHC
jgi:sRNA-binding carbon storage regulator CsrA